MRALLTRQALCMQCATLNRTVPQRRPCMPQRAWNWKPAFRFHSYSVPGGRNNVRAWSEHVIIHKLKEMDLEQYKVEKVPATAYYVPDFINKDEETYLTEQVYSAPKPKWKQLSNRRLQNWGGLPHPKGMIAEKLPKWLEVYSQKIADLGVFGGDVVPNHVLVNEYQPGQGIMPHEDGSLFHPVVTTISLGSHTLLDFYPHRRDANEAGDTATRPSQDNDKPSDASCQEPAFSLLLQPCSLLVLKDDMYTAYLHGIAGRTDDVVTEAVANRDQTGRALGDALPPRSCRVSLTVRHVPKTLKMKLFGKR